MGQDLTKHSQARSSSPVAPSRELVSVVDRLTNALEAIPGGRRMQVRDVAAPTDAEKSVLVARREALLTTLQPAHPDEIGRAISMMRQAFDGGPAMSQEDISTTRKLYVMALSPFPMWAVSEACRQVIEGKAGLNTAFAPKPPQMAELCRSLVMPFREEKGRIDAILTAEVYTLPSDEERARIAAGFDELVAGLKRVPDEKRMTDEQRGAGFVAANQRLMAKDLQHAGIEDDGAGLSPELRMKIAGM